MTQSEVNSSCIDYLINNRDKIRSKTQSLLDKRMSLLKVHDIAFAEHINEEFVSLTKSVILVELARNLNFTPEQLILFMEEFNINNYLDFI